MWKYLKVYLIKYSKKINVLTVRFSLYSLFCYFDVGILLMADDVGIYWTVAWLIHAIEKLCIFFFVFFSGAMGIIWAIIWWFLAFEKPSKHPYISHHEKVYIETCIGENTSVLHTVSQSITFMLFVNEVI